MNSSPARWPALPIPADAMLTFPGLALAWAMNSGTVRAGTDRLTAMIRGALLMPATSAMSRMKLKLSFS
jgi:hypothetical protein